MNFRGQLIALRTILRKEVVRILRIWVQTIVPPVITMTLYFIIFGSLIGRRIGLMGGFDYMQYIAPGLIMMSVITNSYGNVVSSFFGAKFGKAALSDLRSFLCKSIGKSMWVGPILSLNEIAQASRVLI